MAHYSHTFTIGEAVNAPKTHPFENGSTRWAGFSSDATREAYERDGYSAEAVEAMRAAIAALAETERATTLQRATVGAWDIPSAINGLPVCAIRRKRIASTPLALRVNISPNCNTKAAPIAEQTARLASALRSEVAKGRAITLTVAVNLRVIRAHGRYQKDDTIQFIYSVDVSRDDELATALSMQFFRHDAFRMMSVDGNKTTGRYLDGAINFGDNNTRMMSELNAILAA